MRGRTFLSNVLLDLEFSQFRDQPAPEEKANQQSSDACERRAEGQVPKNPEWAEVWE